MKSVSTEIARNRLVTGMATEMQFDDGCRPTNGNRYCLDLHGNLRRYGHEYPQKFEQFRKDAMWYLKTNIS